MAAGKQAVMYLYCFLKEMFKCKEGEESYLQSIRSDGFLNIFKGVVFLLFTCAIRFCFCVFRLLVVV